MMTMNADLPLKFGRATVCVADVTHVTAERNYVRLHLNSGVSTRVRGVMEKLEQSLSGRGFVRLGRGALVNLAAVRGVQRVGRDLTLIVLLSAQRPLRLGRRASRQLRKMMTQQSGGAPPTV